MKKIKIWIDDIREMPKDFDIHIKTVNEAISFINKNYNKIDLISIDHDAGDYASEGGDYIKILDWLEYKQINIPISIHSGNIIGIRNMIKIIKRNNWTYVPTEDEIFSGLFF